MGVCGTVDGSEILHQLIGRLSNYLPGFSTIPGGGRRISEPSAVTLYSWCATGQAHRRPDGGGEAGTEGGSWCGVY